MIPDVPRIGDTEPPNTVACYAECPMFAGAQKSWGPDANLCNRAKLAKTRKPQFGDILATPQQDEVDGCARALFG